MCCSYLLCGWYHWLQLTQIWYLSNPHPLSRFFQTFLKKEQPTVISWNHPPGFRHKSYLSPSPVVTNWPYYLTWPCTLLKHRHYLNEQDLIGNYLKWTSRQTMQHNGMPRAEVATTWCVTISPFSLYRLMLDHLPLNTVWKGKVMLVYWERTIV